MTLVLALAALAFAGLLMTSLQTFLTRRFLGGRRPFALRPRERAERSEAPSPRGASSTPSPGSPRVSILKPLCGPEDDLEENLASFAALEGVSYEVVLTAADPDRVNNLPTAHAATGAASARIRARNKNSQATNVGTPRQAAPHHRRLGFPGTVGDRVGPMKEDYP